MRKMTMAVAAAISAGLGLFALVDGATGNMGWVRFQPGWVPMQIGTCLSLMACAAALALLAARRGQAAAVLGAVGGLLGMLPFPSSLPESLRAEPVSAVCAALAGAALIMAGARRQKGPVVATAGILLAAFGTTAFFCYLRGITTAFGWEGLMRVPVAAAAGYAALGFGLLAWPGEKAGAEEGAPNQWLPLAAGLAAATVSVCLWAALVAEQNTHIRWVVGGAAEDIKERLQSVQEKGALKAALSQGQLFGSVLPGAAPRTYALQLFVGDLPAYTSRTARAPGGDAYVQDVEAQVGGEVWRVRVWPTEELLASLSSSLPNAVLGVGLILSMLLALSIHLAVLARFQAEEIEKQRKQAQAASDLKSRFLGNISRELRNPLNAILGFSDVILGGGDGPLSKEQREDLGSVREGGRRLAGLAEQLLELARLEAGMVKLTPERLSVTGLLEEVRSAFASEAARKGLALEVEAGPANAVSVNGDRARLREALGSVVDNAMRFTSKGKVTLSFRDGDGEIVLMVRDTGVGLSPEENDNLFEPFWQSRGLQGVKKADGLGLGLHLARRVVELHGGRMSGVGDSRNGSVFYLCLPRSGEEKS